MPSTYNRKGETEVQSKWQKDTPGNTQAQSRRPEAPRTGTDGLLMSQQPCKTGSQRRVPRAEDHTQRREKTNRRRQPRWTLDTGHTRISTGERTLTAQYRREHVLTRRDGRDRNELRPEDDAPHSERHPSSLSCDQRTTEANRVGQEKTARNKRNKYHVEKAL